MATLLARLTKMKQYNKNTAIVKFDIDPNDWNIFKDLKVGDSAIFLSKNSILLGDFEKSKAKSFVQFIKVRNLPVTNDELLCIEAISPEIVSRIKANFKPFIPSVNININDVYNAIKNKMFISFYITKNPTDTTLSSILKEGDRVVTINDYDKFDNLFFYTRKGLIPATLSNEFFKVRNLTLNEILLLHQNAKRTEAKRPVSNNVNSVNLIIRDLNEGKFYKFKSFGEYYNIIHNKQLYSKNIPTSGGTGGVLPDKGSGKKYDLEPAKNIILYGPPGTGKTYHSISHAISIVDKVNIIDVLERCETDRDIIKAKFDGLVEEGRIGFCTFHQSMSYEDFIEGIKPKEPHERDTFLKYAVQDGIFKKLCTDAAYSFFEISEKDELEIIEPFEEKYKKYITSLKANISNNNPVTVQTKNKITYIINSASDSEIILSKNQNTPIKKVTKAKLLKLAKAFPDHNIGNIQREFRKVVGGNITVAWALLNDIRAKFPENEVLNNQTSATENHEKLSYIDYLYKKDAIKQLVNEDYKVDNENRFVLIIDEINRGNVSQIFGELITLIENDKRLGNDESLLASLPYSGEEFGVPPNLYIIGTMNTADRSVEALDTALRRRFSFYPMMPIATKLTANINTINLKDMLITLNNRLRILKDNDHTIGHAWFMGVTNYFELKTVFKDKIIPLLQEYFYNDYEKLGLVLGDAFFETPHTRVNGNEFAKFTGNSGLSSQYKNKYIYKLKNVDELSSDDFLTLCQPSKINED